MRKNLIFIVMLFIIGACSTVPSSDDYDWCWIYDFTAYDYGFSLDEGVWIEDVGFVSIVQEDWLDYNENDIIGDAGDILLGTYGELSINYQYPFSNISDETVDITHITIALARGEGYDPNEELNLTTSGEIYGVSINNPTATALIIPAGMTAGEFTIQDADGGPSTDIIDTSLQIRVNGESIAATLAIPRIVIYGSYDNPFPFDACGDATPTPNPSTPTATPTATNTPTETFTPSPTPDPDDNIFITFSSDDGSYQDYTYGAFFTQDPYIWTTTAPHDEVLKSTRWCCYTVGSTNYYSLSQWVDVEFDEPVTINTIAYNVYYSRSSDNGNPAHVYTFYDEFNAEIDSVQTGFSTLSNWVGYSTSPYISGVYRVRVAVFRGGSVIASNAQLLLDNISIDYTPDTEPTPTPLESPTPSDTPEATGTLEGDTATPDPSATLIPSGTPFATYEAGEGTPTPSDAERENEVESEILDELKRHDNVVENQLGGIGDSLGGIGDQLGGIGDSLDDLNQTNEDQKNIAEQIGDTVSDIATGISDAVGSVADIGNKLVTYALTAANTIGGIFSSFYGAPPTPISDLPQCMSNPMAHDICAIYYILDWTLFAPGTLGQYIVPLLIAMMYIIMAFRAIRFILKMIRSGEDVTRV